MTKHVADEALPKLHISIEDATSLVDSSVKLLESPSLEICGCGGARVHSVHKVSSAKSATLKTHTPKPAFKRLEKIMQKLYDLEPQSGPEKPLNVDLDVDLYQMEDY